MHERYINTEIKTIWSDKNKLGLWQKTEEAVIEAMEKLGKIPVGTSEKIKSILMCPIDIDLWKKTDKEIHHDLNAFIFERQRCLQAELQQYFHKKLTSYDTEEPAFARMLMASYEVISPMIDEVLKILESMAKKYRYTIMYAKTHGQGAEMQSFGKRCLTWRVDLREDRAQLDQAAKNLKYSKLSGAIGNYGSLDPQVEAVALGLLDLIPYYGATQIMPRELYLPLASALVQVVGTLNKIALAIRLGARSGNPIYHEPFGKKQTGSSAMPHKKNTIRTEQMEGMFRMAKGYLNMITDNISTWEERAIEQSCVERVAWPDLFHVTARSIIVMANVLAGLRVYTDNMLRELAESKGCYASSEAKEFLAERGAEVDLTKEECYRIVQLAAFVAFGKSETGVPGSLATADQSLEYFSKFSVSPSLSIEDIIMCGSLHQVPELGNNNFEVKLWNEKLEKIFSEEGVIEKWQQIFKPSYLLRNEEILFDEILAD